MEIDLGITITEVTSKGEVSAVATAGVPIISIEKHIPSVIRGMSIEWKPLEPESTGTTVILQGSVRS